MRRTRLKRTAMRRRVSGLRRASPKRRLEIDMDRQARLACIMAAGGRCERCEGYGPLEWHHIITRSCLALRWAPLNGMCLCVACHRWWHASPRRAKAWLETLCPGRYAELQRLRG